MGSWVFILKRYFPSKLCILDTHQDYCDVYSMWNKPVILSATMKPSCHMGSTCPATPANSQSPRHCHFYVYTRWNQEFIIYIYIYWGECPTLIYPVEGRIVKLWCNDKMLWFVTYEHHFTLAMLRTAVFTNGLARNAYEAVLTHEWTIVVR